jgi:hypothetical protein
MHGTSIRVHGRLARTVDDTPDGQVPGARAGSVGAKECRHVAACARPAERPTPRRFAGAGVAQRTACSSGRRASCRESRAESAKEFGPGRRGDGEPLRLVLTKPDDDDIPVRDDEQPVVVPAGGAEGGGGHAGPERLSITTHPIDPPVEAINAGAVGWTRLRVAPRQRGGDLGPGGGVNPRRAQELAIVPASAIQVEQAEAREFARRDVDIGLMVPPRLR